jgi:hypothetical protein
MRQGRLDEPRAAILVSTLRDLDDEQARLVVSRVLGRAPELPHGALATLTEKTAASVDEDWAEARRRAAEARARVVARIGPSGAAEISGLDLPVDPALEAHGHVVALADAVHAAARARGRDLPLGVVQSHVFVRLLQHDLLGAADATVVETLTDELAPEPPDSPDVGPDDADGPRDGGPEGPDGPRGGPDNATRGEDPRDLDPEDQPDVGSHSAVADDPHTCMTGALPFRSGVAVRLALTTLLGRDRRPGEIPGWGSATGDTACRLARRRPDASWRVHLYDAAGQFVDVLMVHPTTDRGGATGRHRRQVVEVTATAGLLDSLDAAAHLGTDAVLIRQAQAALAELRARSPEDDPEVSTADARRRLPRARLDRYVRGRDRCCRFAGCTRSAISADLDHTLDWLYGGLTVGGNLGALCRYHHRLKHDADSGWSLTQPHPGRFEWISPQGARHTVEPETELELPEPLAPAGGGFSVPADALVPFSRAAEPWAPRRNRAGHLTDAARATAEDVARRLRIVEGMRPTRYDTDPDF